MDIRPLRPEDRADWEPLWQGYLAFCQRSVPDAVTDLSWRRLHDPAEPMHGYGAFAEEGLAGIMHLVLRRSMWTEGSYCYLEDLFTAPWARRRGVGRALIEHSYGEAKRLGCPRVYWLTQESNAQARALYETVADRSGFIQYRKIL